MKRYAVVGSRRWKDRQAVVDLVESFPAGTIVISGGCRGVDTWAVEAAKARGLAVKVHKPDLTGCRQRWEFTRRYYARNELIARECDVLFAYVVEGKKGGTANTIKYAERYGKKVVKFKCKKDQNHG